MVYIQKTLPAEQSLGGKERTKYLLRADNRVTSNIIDKYNVKKKKLEILDLPMK